MSPDHSHGSGNWVSRERRGVAHLAESVVAGDFVTRCGRRLSDEPTKSGGEVVFAPFGLAKCRYCAPTTETPT